MLRGLLQVGITSWGHTQVCSASFSDYVPNYACVFIKVAPYLGWLAEVEPQEWFGDVAPGNYSSVDPAGG